LSKFYTKVFTLKENLVLKVDSISNPYFSIPQTSDKIE
jgi:hypothetical protein